MAKRKPIEGIVDPLDALRRMKPEAQRKFIENVIEKLLEKIDTLEAERDKAIQGVADMRETLEAWFDTSKRVKADAVPLLKDGFAGYLRTCRVGGMQSDYSDAAQAAFDDFADKYVGLTLAPLFHEKEDADA